MSPGSGPDVLVLGAGPAGVGAAYRAARAGHRVVVLERSTAPGGMAGSFEVGGQRVDHGSHRLHPTTDAAVLAELRRLLGGELQLRPRNGRIRLAGRWIAFPLRPADLLRRLPKGFALAAARDAALAPLRRPGADTFAEVVRAGLGPALAERFYFPYARKLWGLEPDRIAGEQARRRIGASSPGKLLRRVLGSGGRSAVFWYPRRGYGQISEALAAAAETAGAELRYGAEAEAVELGDDRVRVRLAGDEQVEAGRLWTTLPLTVLARMTSPPPPATALEAASRLEFRAMLLVYLVLDVDRYTAFDAHYLPEAWTPVTRVSEPKNYRDGDDVPGRTVLCAELPCSRDDRLWTASDEELGAIAADALEGAGLPRPQVVETFVRRLPFVYPVYSLGYESAVRALDDWAEAQPRLLTFGRLGLFVHDNTHHALAMAWAAADSLRADGSFDDAAWRAARERFAAHVVED
ncbi:MAG TPA: FAD-dependent oxidoreductase [Gaiellaceae bacterium]|nr:FAD-dependent oxidoreductase [Gaiellaceae bacterium]